MPSTVALLLVLLVLVNQSDAARKVDAEARARVVRARRSMEFFRRSLVGNHPTVTELLDLTPDEHLDLKKEVQMREGLVTKRYEESYKGLKVYDTVVTVRVDKSDHITGDLSGVFVQGIDEDIPDVTPVLSEDDVIRIAKELNHDTGSDVTILTTNVRLEIYLDPWEKARLAYFVDYTVVPAQRGSSGRYKGRENPRRPETVIDAMTGEVLRNLELMQNAGYKSYSSVGGNLKTNLYHYDGITYDKLRLTKNGNQCIFENDVVKVYHMNSGETTPDDPFTFPCSSGFNDSANGAYSPASDAMYFSQIVNDMFNSFDPSAMLPLPLIMRVHYGVDFENAFWDGRQMTFGDGESFFYPLVSLDVTCHEVSHGITQQNNGLIYQSESGGLNEAFSDIAGEVAKYYMKNSNDWLLGYDIVKADRPLRWMADPPRDNRSIDHARDFYPAINVHYSSGIPNKAFYLLTTTTGWDINKAFTVVLKAALTYWHASTGFDKAACDMIKSAQDLGYDHTAVQNAFAAVGVEGCLDHLTSHDITNTPHTTDMAADNVIQLVIHPSPDAISTTIQFTASDGDGNLKAKQSYPPSQHLNALDVDLALTSDQVDISFSSRDPLYLRLTAQTAVTGLTVSNSFVPVPPLPTPASGHVLNDGVTESMYFYYDLAADAAELSFTINTLHPTPGDLDLYLKHGQVPDASTYDGSSTSPSNNEKVTYRPAASGRYYMLIHPYTPAADNPVMIMVNKS